MEALSGRLRREYRTFRCMTRIYCNHHHGSHGTPICPECESFLAYVERRLQKCPYGAAKPTCAKCPIHCYKQAQREMAREIMRFAGPRMTWRHPLRSVGHLLDKLRTAKHPLELRRARSDGGRGVGRKSPP